MTIRAFSTTLTQGISSFCSRVHTLTIFPLPSIVMMPLSSIIIPDACCRSTSAAIFVQCTRPTKLFDSILEARCTVSPKRQYLGLLDPTTPATTGPAMKQKQKVNIWMPCWQYIYRMKTLKTINATSTIKWIENFKFSSPVFNGQSIQSIEWSDKFLSLSSVFAFPSWHL